MFYTYLHAIASPSLGLAHNQRELNGGSTAVLHRPTSRTERADRGGMPLAVTQSQTGTDAPGARECSPPMRNPLTSPSLGLAHIQHGLSREKHRKASPHHDSTRTLGAKGRGGGRRRGANENITSPSLGLGEVTSSHDLARNPGQCPLRVLRSVPDLDSN